jgi:hypothetical protein
MDAVGGLGNDTPTAPYELSVAYTTLAKSPAIVAVGADGYLYTGGAHAIAADRALRLVAEAERDADLRQARARSERLAGDFDFVREQLHTALSQRIDADDVPPKNAPTC